LGRTGREKGRKGITALLELWDELDPASISGILPLGWSRSSMEVVAGGYAIGAEHRIGAAPTFQIHMKMKTADSHLMHPI